MIDVALIHQCADPDLKPAIVERFIEQAGSPDALAVTIRTGNRVVLAPRPTTSEEALELVRQHVGRNVVRVGITQYPAGLGISDSRELRPDLLDACANVRMGTALFAKVYRIVVKWYGGPRDEAVEDAILAWRTGTFEGIGVFNAPDPGGVSAVPAGIPPKDVREEAPPEAGSAQPVQGPEDPNKAGIRVDLSGIGNRP
ncbi:TraH family protein [Xanthobacter sp. DSM 24535]|uniref:TraH family protein n=1 Tax=Roseixanthobacter psychrophilus TaxID=3119917 RepID=UPI003729114B